MTPAVRDDELPPSVDCDVHPVLTSVTPLLPYLDDYWRDLITNALSPSYEPNTHPPGAPNAQRPGLRVDAEGRAGTSAENLCADLFDDGPDLAVLQCLYGVQQIHQPQMERAQSRALNTWLAEQWLDRDPRLRGSIVVPIGTPAAAVEEIEHWADDERFVQVLLPSHSELLYGRELYWPVWEAAERAGLAVSIHLGQVGRNAPSPAGWGSTYLEWYVGQQSTMEAQVASIVSSGVLERFPGTRILIAEAGFAWLPALIWKLDKGWKGYRADTPWLDRLPSESVREHVRLTTAPCDGIADAVAVQAFVDRVESDEMLVFSSDYPHRHALPPGVADAALGPAFERRVRRDNPRWLYGRRGRVAPTGTDERRTDG